jgi:Tfp pilus assembly protein PilE
MSPSTYYCWLADRLYRVVRLQRLLPPPTRPLPALFLIAVPVTAAVVITGLFWLLVSSIMLADGRHFSTEGPSWGIDRLVWALVAVAIGSFGVATALICWLVWNQRAARLRAGEGESAGPIPPPHPALRWTLGLGYFAVFSIFTPLVMLGALENAMGALAWRNTRATLTAKGERLTVDAVMPAPVPAEQDFSSLPEFAALFQVDPKKPRSEAEQLQDPFRVFQLPHYALADRILPNGKTDPTPTPLHDWAEAFRTDHRLAIGNITNPPPRADEPLAEKNNRMLKRTPKQHHRPRDLPEYPAAPDGADDGTVIRTALTLGDPAFERIAQALTRPSARFPVRWNDGFNALLPHLAKLKGLQLWIELRTRAKLAQGDVDGAFADARSAIRLADVVRDEPLLISQLVWIAQQAIAARTVDFGIRSHQWTEPQLKEFQALFNRTGMLGLMAGAFEGERAMALSTMDAWCSRPSEMDRVLPEELPGFMTPRGFGMRIPGVVGLIRHNQSTLANYYSLLIRTTRATEENGQRSGFNQELKALEAQMDTTLNAMTAHASAYTMLTRQLAPSVSKAVDKSVRGEQRAGLTATACAVERFRKQHGNYPATLHELVPALLTEVPLDIMDHQPLRYRKNSDDTFILWSVGDNGIDDGGIFRNPKSNSDEILDWVWPY